MKRMIQRTAVVVSVVLTCSPIGAMAANKLIVKDSGGTVDKFSVTDTGYIGVGHSAPTSSIHAIGVSSPRDAQLLLQHNPAAATTSGGGGVILYYNESGALPTVASARLGYIYFGAYDGATQRNAAGLKAITDGSWVTNSSTPTAFIFETTPSGSLTRTERMRITNSGNVGIGTTAPVSKLHVVGLPVYSNNTQATGAGLTAGAFYRTGGDPDLVCVVH